MNTWIDFKKLRSKLDFEEVLRHYGVEVKRKGDQHHGFCPLPNHNGKKNSPSFSANLERGIFQCFGCGAKGNLLEFAAMMEKADPKDGTALHKVAGQLQKRFCPQLDTPSKAEKASAKKPGEAKPESDVAVIINAPLDFELKGLDAEHPYLPGRGFTPETVGHFGLGFCSRGMLKDRIAIPLHDHEGRLVGYAGRVVNDAAISEDNPRYRFPGSRERDGKLFEFRKTLFLYNGFQFKASVEDLIVVESFTSVWWLTQNGLTNVVATMGADCSEKQAELIVSLVKPTGRVWFLTDGDSAGERHAHSLLTQISAHRFTRWVELADGKQPPVFTMLLSGAFKIWGPSLLAARLIAGGFGLILFLVFYDLVRQRCGQWAAILAVFFLVASPAVLLFSVSVMLEVPAIGTALLSAWFLFQWRKRRHWGWLLASGTIMAVALQIKLTAVMIVPAMLVEIVLTQRLDHNPSWKRVTLRHLFQWCMAVSAVFVLITLLWAKGSYTTSFKSHFTAHQVAGLPGPEEHHFEARMPLHHIECIIAAIVALFLIARRNRWREFAFPIVLLLTGGAIHAVHRPWWAYYYLHFAVPLAWLAGYALSEITHSIYRLLSANRARSSSPTAWKAVTLMILAAAALAASEARLEAGVSSIRKSPRASDSPVLMKMKQYSSGTHWVYAQPIIYPFHAELPVPPELAVVMLKRFWSGQITTKEIVEICKRYKPEQVLLFTGRIGTEWKDILSTSYTVAYQDKDFVLFVAKQITNK